MSEIKKENPLEMLPINKLLVKFSVPSIIAMLVTALYNIVDQFFIGQAVGSLGNAATSMKSAGYVKLPYVLAICISLSSSGCRRISSAPLRNSGSSSINKTPRCAREITPGLGILPPPASACSEIV